MQKIKNIHCVDPEQSTSQTDRQTDSLAGRQKDRQKDGLMNGSGL